MFSKCAIFFAVLYALTAVNAAPALVELSERQSITALTTAQISAFRPFSHFASTAYCSPSTTINWSCGANCNANSDFIPTASGGDGSDIQFWYVGFSPSQNTVIVAHQGPISCRCNAADLTDVDVILESLNPSLFPGVSSSVKTHSGFANEQAKTAATILSAVQTTIRTHSATVVTIVGHSLGAAIALLDGVYLPLHISGVRFRVIGYGLPRVGNQAFADYVDVHLALTHVNNKEDTIPIVPGRFLGYHHPSGEVHIMDSGSWVSCPGQDNPSTECIVGDVPNILVGNESDHDGPYDGVKMGC
ncbi:lipase class 3 family protein [Pholiota molesta]|nr:lipase class 3 family protein [Pholiota molesta]